jgi:CarD family transcriptional regulator
VASKSASLKKIPETEDAADASFPAPGSAPEGAPENVSESAGRSDLEDAPDAARESASAGAGNQAGETERKAPGEVQDRTAPPVAASPRIATMPPRPAGGIPGRVMPPPRPMAKAEQFAEGDHVVYPTHGVGKVERIATEEIAGHKLELIHITFEENRMTLRVPVTKARTAGLRKLATRKMFDEAMTVLRGRPRIKRTMWSRRAQEYEAKINSGDPLAIAEVVRDLHRNSGQPDQSFSERQIYEAAMDRLAAELAALERIDKATAATKLVEFLKTV